MKIAYRRMSGAIGLTEKELGTRGLWFEKRKALVNELRQRGHKVDFLNRMTKYSKKYEKQIKLDHDILFIEFGSNNTLSYGDDLKETVDLVKKYKGTKIFLCDDPDLPFIWRSFDKEELENFSCWLNCCSPKYFGGCPEYIPLYDFPFSSLQKNIDPSSYYNKDYFVYIGRPNGREKEISILIENKIPWRVYGDPKHWAKFNIRVLQPPTQPMRAMFYNKVLGSIVLADKKHRDLGWRTGRAYNAILSGCPALVEGSHPGLSKINNFNSVSELSSFFEKWKDPVKRKKDWIQQLEIIKGERKQAEKVFKEFNL